MNIPPFAAFKYEHDDRLSMTWKQRAGVLLGFVLMLVCFFISVPVGFVAMFAAFIFMGKSWPQKRICISPRYLVCGKSVLYFRNIDKVVLEAEQGNLTLYSGTKKSLRILQDKFPTGARKAPKVAANKKAKFTKISHKIIAKVIQASPDAQLVGISKSQVGAETNVKAAKK